MNDLYLMFGILAGVIGFGVLIGYLKKKNIIDENIGDDITNAIVLAKLIMEVLPLEKKSKDKATFILEVSDEVANYIHFLERNDIDKEKLTLETTLNILEKFNVTPTDSEKQLMTITVQEALKRLNSQK